MNHFSYRNILIFSISVFLCSCSLNKWFLKPFKVPESLTQFDLVDPETKDTTVFKVYGANKQPVFLKNGKDTVKFDFTTEGIMLQSGSGNKINGWFMKPKNTALKITLLHFHGNGGFILSQNQSIGPLLKKGFQVFTFDYSGYGYSEGEATRDNVKLDALAALNYVRSRPDVKNTKIVIYGQSLGGNLAAVVARENQNLIDGLVIEGAFTSHKDIAANRAGFVGRILTKEKYSGEEAVKNFHKPVLIIHSSEDKVIPFSMGKELFANANEPKEFYEIQKCHICGPQFYSDSISAKIRNLVKN